MTETTAPGRRAAVAGPTAKTFARNLLALRRERELTARQLADRVTEHGHPTSASTVNRTENGGRVPTVDDLTAFAAALGVSPVDLLLPRITPPDAATAVTGAGSPSAVQAMEWVTGRSALPENTRSA